MSGVYKTETTTLVTPVLKVWMNQFSLILEHLVQREDPDDWSIRMEVLQCLNQFVQNFPFLIESELMAIMRPLWHTFESSLQTTSLLRSSIEGAEDSYDGRYDSDGEEKSLDSFVIQLFEFLSTIIGSRRLAKHYSSSKASSSSDEDESRRSRSSSKRSKKEKKHKSSRDKHSLGVI